MCASDPHNSAQCIKFSLLLILWYIHVSSEVHTAYVLHVVYNHTKQLMCMWKYTHKTLAFVPSASAHDSIIVRKTTMYTRWC